WSSDVCSSDLSTVHQHLNLRSDEGLDIVCSDKIFAHMHVAMRVDLRNAFPHRLHLGLSKCAVKRVQLPVDIGLGNIVQIDQSDGTDARARQGFRAPGTYTSDASHGNMRPLQTR